MKYIHFLTKRSIGELRPLDIAYRMDVVVEISKVISKEEARAKAEQSLARLQKEVEYFYDKFNKILEAGLPNLWGKNGELFTQELYNIK